MIEVNCNALADNQNYELAQNTLFLGMPAALFTINMDGIPAKNFQQFFDSLEPTFSHMISLGQTNTIVSCPGLTTHSELNLEQQKKAQIYPTTIRFAVGNENPMDLIKHLVSAAALTVDETVPDYSKQFMSIDQAKDLVKNIYLDMHQKYIEAIT